jgi:hypothetical protein
MNRVEALANFNTSRKQSIQAYRAEMMAAHTAEAAVRTWYDQARRLSKLALQQTDPTNQDHLQQLLGV